MNLINFVILLMIVIFLRIVDLSWRKCKNKIIWFCYYCRCNIGCKFLRNLSCRFVVYGILKDIYEIMCINLFFNYLGK